MDLQAQRRPDIAGDGRVSVPLGDGGELVIVPGYEHSASAALISNAQPQCASRGSQRVRGGSALLDPADVQVGVFQVHLLPA